MKSGRHHTFCNVCRFNTAVLKGRGRPTEQGSIVPLVKGGQSGAARFVGHAATAWEEPSSLWKQLPCTGLLVWEAVAGACEHGACVSHPFVCVLCRMFVQVPCQFSSWFVDGFGAELLEFFMYFGY